MHRFDADADGVAVALAEGGAVALGDGVCDGVLDADAVTEGVVEVVGVVDGDADVVGTDGGGATTRPNEHATKAASALMVIVKRESRI